MSHSMLRIGLMLISFAYSALTACSSPPVRKLLPPQKEETREPSGPEAEKNQPQSEPGAQLADQGRDERVQNPPRIHEFSKGLLEVPVSFKSLPEGLRPADKATYTKYQLPEDGRSIFVRFTNESEEVKCVVQYEHAGVTGFYRSQMILKDGEYFVRDAADGRTAAERAEFLASSCIRPGDTGVLWLKTTQELRDLLDETETLQLGAVTSSRTVSNDERGRRCLLPEALTSRATDELGKERRTGIRLRHPDLLPRIVGGAKALFDSMGRVVHAVSAGVSASTKIEPSIGHGMIEEDLHFGTIATNENLPVELQVEVSAVLDSVQFWLRDFDHSFFGEDRGPSIEEVYQDCISE